MWMWFAIPLGVGIVVAPASAMAATSPSATIAGTVTLTTADGATFSGEGVRLILACATRETRRTEVSDEHGAFRFLDVPVDSCSIQADLQGFAAPPVSVVTVAGQVIATQLYLGIVPLRVGVNVGGPTPFREPTMLSRFCESDAGQRPQRSKKDRSRDVCGRRRSHSENKDYSHVTSND